MSLIPIFPSFLILLLMTVLIQFTTLFWSNSYFIYTHLTPNPCNVDCKANCCCCCCCRRWANSAMAAFTAAIVVLVVLLCPSCWPCCTAPTTGRPANCWKAGCPTTPTPTDGANSTPCACLWWNLRAWRTRRHLKTIFYNIHLTTKFEYI